MARNLYIHFPFCRRKCSYCALHSRAGVSAADRAAYVAALVRAVAQSSDLSRGGLSTIYFGGGSPALCDLAPLLDTLAPLRADDCEFTVELHPLDVTPALLDTLRTGGVNRISMGVQSLDDGILAHMGRGYTFAEAERAFLLVRERFENAGIDLIVGYPGETGALIPRHARLAKWGLAHCSAYSLILEERTLLHRLTHGPQPLALPDDDTTMNRLRILAAFLHDLGLERYEISNYARPGRECRHNLATWRGEDYCGLGFGAHGRIGLTRTQNLMGDLPGDAFRWGLAPSVETVDAATDAKERTLFRLRTRDGLDAAGHDEWLPALTEFVTEGLLTQDGTTYRLTPRGAEVCDTILAALV